LVHLAVTLTCQPTGFALAPDTFFESNPFIKHVLCWDALHYNIVNLVRICKGTEAQKFHLLLRLGC
jgi:hypothetical protein